MAEMPLRCRFWLHPWKTFQVVEDQHYQVCQGCGRRRLMLWCSMTHIDPDGLEYQVMRFLRYTRDHDTMTRRVIHFHWLDGGAWDTHNPHEAPEASTGAIALISSPALPSAPTQAPIAPGKLRITVEDHLGLVQVFEDYDRESFHYGVAFEDPETVKMQFSRRP